MLSRLKFEISPLVKEMLDQIPSSVWSSSSTTFLDPAMGGGQFLVEIEGRLRSAGHSDDNISSRVFGCEKNKLRVNYAKNNKKLVSKNLHISNFLNQDWGDMKFDVIIGNPPYQDENLPENNALWPQFVNKSFCNLLKDGGILAMITPSSWMNPSGEDVKRREEYNTGAIRKNILGKYKTIRVDVSENVRKHFAVGSTFSYYVVEKTLVSDHITCITTDAGKLDVDLAKVKFLPALLSPHSYSICNKFFNKPAVGVTNMKGEGFHSSHSKRVVKDKKPGYCYPLADTSAKYLKGNWLWANEPHPYQSDKKVIISESGYLGPMYDPGKLGTTEHSFVILVDSESAGLELVTQLNSCLYLFIMTVCRWGSANHKYIIKNLPACKGTTDADIYAFFGLSLEEIHYVESVTKKNSKPTN